MAGASLLALGACSTIQGHERIVQVKPEVMHAYLADKPEKLRPYYERVLLEGERNVVLNHMRSGLAAMEEGAVQTAAGSFDMALERIEAIYANNEKAAQARSTFIKENIKDFKGEPYERVMAYYYRGLLYLREGDYENARASFKGGMLQDAWAENTTYQADFALMAYLEGWASHCLGNASLAKDSFDEAKRLRDDLPIPGEGDNLLLLAETGKSPVKIAMGKYKERLEYVPGVNFDRGAVFSVLSRQSTSERDAALAEDIYWQATTRGGRQIQAILDGKAEFKDAAGTVGNVATAAGAGVLAGAAYTRGRHRDEAAIAGAAILLVGLIVKGIEAATRPEADIRYWDNLPDRVHLTSLKAPNAPYTVVVQYKTVDGDYETPKPVEVTQAGKCSVGWSRSRSAIPTQAAAPNAVAQ